MGISVRASAPCRTAQQVAPSRTHTSTETSTNACRTSSLSLNTRARRTRRRGRPLMGEREHAVHPDVVLGRDIDFSCACEHNGFPLSAFYKTALHGAPLTARMLSGSAINRPRASGSDPGSPAAPAAGCPAQTAVRACCRLPRSRRVAKRRSMQGTSTPRMANGCARNHGRQST